MRLLHNSHSVEFRSPFGAVATNTAVILRLEVWGEAAPARVAVRFWEHEERLLAMECESESAGKWLYRATFVAPKQAAVLWYFFQVEAEGRIVYYGDQADGCGGVGVQTATPPLSYQLTVYEPWPVPAWLSGTLVYQIFPDRFFNPFDKPIALPPGALLHGDWQQPPLYARACDTGEVLGYDFYGGNLAGIQAKLPYLADLGVRVIYCNPIFSAVSNHKYDTGDYEAVDAGFGGDEALRALCRAAAGYGIRLVLDGVFSHTGSDSRYFNKENRFADVGAYQSEASPYRSWYRFRTWPDDYDCWWGNDNLPNVNELDPAYLDYIIRAKTSIVARWQKAGIKGWRLDVADELPTSFIRLFRERLKGLDADSALIGEVWEDASRKVSYGELRSYFNGRELDSVMNYPFREAVVGYLTGAFDGAAALRRLYGLYEHYPRPAFMALWNLIGTHDVVRALTALGDASPEALSEQARRTYRLPREQKKTALARLRLAVFWQLTFPGAPLIYYGDEAGVEGFADPYNRSAFPWGREDEAVLSWYWRMTGLRQRYPVLAQGEWRPLPAPPEAVAFWRMTEQELALAMLNRSEAEVRAVLPADEGAGQTLTEVFSGEQVVLAPGVPLVAPPGECRLWVKEVRWPDRKRAAGVLLHPTSLPSAYGGDVGPAALQFLDFLAAAGQSVWQLLPLNPTGWEGSPYAGTSAMAVSCLLLSPEGLWQDGWLDKATLEGAKVLGRAGERFRPAETVRRKSRLFHQAWAAARHERPPDYEVFCHEQAWWLEDFALFAAARKRFGGRGWWTWPEELRQRQPAALAACRRDWAQELDYQRFLQYAVQRQWRAVQARAKGLGIALVGDIPLYVAADSADVWAHQEWFMLDEQGRPTLVAGVPPDYFSADGQLWGNPLYRWDVMAQDGYRWWTERLRRTLSFCDVVRLDHFRGIEAHWAVSAGERTARNGRWLPGPGADLLRALRAGVGALPCLAEDLGVITREVRLLREQFHLPGMEVLQFMRPTRPEAVLYTGTHDNATLLGWYLAADPQAKALARELGLQSGRTEPAQAAEALLQYAYAADNTWVVTPLADLLKLGDEARFNRPGTVSDENWSWRVPPDMLSLQRAEEIRRRTHAARRC